MRYCTMNEVCGFGLTSQLRTQNIERGKEMGGRQLGLDVFWDGFWDGWMYSVLLL